MTRALSIRANIPALNVPALNVLDWKNQLTFEETSDSHGGVTHNSESLNILFEESRLNVQLQDSGGRGNVCGSERIRWFQLWLRQYVRLRIYLTSESGFWNFRASNQNHVCVILSVAWHASQSFSPASFVGTY